MPYQNNNNMKTSKSYSRSKILKAYIQANGTKTLDEIVVELYPTLDYDLSISKQDHKWFSIQITILNKQS